MQTKFAFAFGLMLVFASPPALVAQGGAPQLPRPVTSCGPTALILVTVVDGAGNRVSDASIEVRRTRDRKVVRRGQVELPGSGEYVVMDDGALSLVGPTESRFTVQVRRAKQRVSAVLRIGRTPDGCHVRVISGPTRLTVK